MLIKKYLNGLRNWKEEYLADCLEHARTHENLKYIKKYWYLVVAFLALIATLLGVIVYDNRKKDELEQETENEKKFIGKKYSRLR
jgi:hypothetical protein